MITKAQREFILANAIVPEHLVDLMTLVSKGEVHLVQDLMCVAGREWLIVVGYPLGGEYDPAAFGSKVDKILGQFRPKEAWIIAPDLPLALRARASEMEIDYYYSLDLRAELPPGRLARIVDRARAKLLVERASEMTPHHHELTVEFASRAQLHPRVRELAFAMPEYVRSCPESVVLNAWDSRGRLAGFYVADFSADRFTTYVIGCYSKFDYIPWVSDVLMAEMVILSRDRGKEYIHLGLGVNAGIRRFKEKWGGVPAIKYEMARVLIRKPSILEILSGRR